MPIDGLALGFTEVETSSRADEIIDFLGLRSGGVA